MSLGQICWIYAITLTKQMGVITTLSFVAIVLGYGVSVVRYGERVNLVSLGGVVGIIVGIVGIVFNRKGVVVNKENKEIKKIMEMK